MAYGSVQQTTRDQSASPYSVLAPTPTRCQSLWPAENAFKNYLILILSNVALSDHSYRARTLRIMIGRHIEHRLSC